MRMISLDTIEQLAKKYQTEKRTIVREYFQNIFLSYFYQHKNTTDIYFKGGTALRLIYRSPRFSEDLDFSADMFITGPIEEAVIDTLSIFSKENIVTEIEAATPTTGGYLAILRLSAFGMTIPLNLEVSLRKGEKAGVFAAIISDYMPDYTVVQLQEKQLVGEKIAALLTRKKPRDFYDFYFLLRHNLIQDKNRETFGAVLQALEATDIRFDSELKEYLPKSHHMIIRDFKNTLEREIKRYL